MVHLRSALVFHMPVSPSAPGNPDGDCAEGEGGTSGVCERGELRKTLVIDCVDLLRSFQMVVETEAPMAHPRRSQR